MAFVMEGMFRDSLVGVGYPWAACCIGVSSVYPIVVHRLGPRRRATWLYLLEAHQGKSVKSVERPREPIEG